MKNILFLTIILLTSCTELLFAQFEDKQFLSGSAGINFGSINSKNVNSTNSYGYNFDVSIGRFKTNTKAVGWRLSNSLGGGKNLYTTYDGTGLPKEYDKSGINNISVGVGRFWQFYKHFNDKIGIFGGPGIDLTFSKVHGYEVSSDNRYISENKSDKIQFSVGLSAGLYYRFSEKWWVTGSIAFSNPIALDYSFLSFNNLNDDNKYKSQQLNYSLSPNFTFPSVGFGLRYFYNR